jgi:glutathionylspermidine amidase/synthetase
MPSTAADGMPHGTVVGTASNGVTAYNCNYKHLLPAADGEPYDHLNYVRDSRGKLQYSGDKWQCVEYARRTWISQLDIYLPNTPRACDIWERKFVKRLGDGARVSLAMYTSGVTMHRPAVNDLVIWKATETQPFGHVAVVSEVTDEFVRIAEQNAHNDRPWIGGHWARQFSLTRDAQSGAWIMHDAEDPLFGWVRADLDDVAPALPWNPPDEDITSVDGQYGVFSAGLFCCTWHGTRALPTRSVDHSRTLAGA